MWEGILQCLKWLNFNNLQLEININVNYNMLFGILIPLVKYENIASNIICFTPFLNYLSFYKFNNQKSFNRKFHINNKIPSTSRIGPHNLDTISIIIGATLGDTHLEKRSGGIGTRIKFEQSSKNVEYLMWLHSYFSTRGYCNPKIPKLTKRIKDTGVFFHYNFNSYTFSSLNWLQEMFYKKVEFNTINSSIEISNFNDQIQHVPFKTDSSNLKSKIVSFKSSTKYVKVIPNNLEEILTPLSLAIWFSDDGSKLGKGAKIATNCFTFEELQFLCEILNRKYNITSSIHSGGLNKGHTIYIWAKSMTIFSKLVKPNMLPSLHYKLGDY
jgi:ubiquinol-cytochrome c reductase cytochrome b subunit